MKEPLFRRLMFLLAGVILCMLLNLVSSEGAGGSLTACEIEKLVSQLTSPNQEFQLHAAALRDQLRILLENAQKENLQEIDKASDHLLEFDKKFFNLPTEPEKRSIEALVRSRFLKPSVIEEIKRSLATLAKNGQLPSQEPDVEDQIQQWEGKRNLGSLARSGYIPGKRNIGSLARDYQLPSSGKRNLAALARLGFVPSTTTKQNVELVRFNLIPTNSWMWNNKREVKYWPEVSVNSRIKKRNISALKNSHIHDSRQKRSLYQRMSNDEKVSQDVFQNDPTDYEEVKNDLNRMFGQYYTENLTEEEGLPEEKRFLGRILPPTRATSTTHRGRL